MAPILVMATCVGNRTVDDWWGHNCFRARSWRFCHVRNNTVIVAHVGRSRSRRTELRGVGQLTILLSSELIHPLFKRVADGQQRDSLRHKTRKSNWNSYERYHGYRLNPTLSTADIVDFERRYGVALPEEYRHFVLNVGNGGAGPHFGVYRLGMDDNKPMRDSVLTNLAKWFLHQSDWNGPFDEGHTVFEHSEYDAEKYFSDDVMQGAMPICTQGCAMNYWLVVSGPGKGQMWFDDRTVGEGVTLVEDDMGQPVSFGQWYLDWLDEVQAKWREADSS